MIHKTAPTFSVRIFISGPIDVAKQVIRKDCLRGGLCVTIEPTTYIYNGGEEEGYVVGLINYPKFPVTESELFERGKALALNLMAETFQQSVLIMTPSSTEWFTTRDA